MTNCSFSTIEFPACRKRRVEARFDGGEVTSNGGVVLVRGADRLLGLSAAVARGLRDGRQSGKVRHRLVDMLRQRVFGIALGYEDLNDHEALRHDLALQTAADRDRPLASAPTLCRFENRADGHWAWVIHQVLVDVFIASFAAPPDEIVLDIDATDDAVHGRQEGRFFHGFYDHYCFLPLYVFSGDHLLVAYLRRADIDAAKHALGVVKLLVGRLRQAWPGVRIILRADSGFCRWRLLSWCERNRLGYVIGVAKNARLVALAEPEMACAEARFAASGDKQRLFAELRYAAKTWDKTRRVIARLDHGPKGANPRFVVTNLEGAGAALYDRLYCARGEIENRIKEQQLQLFADRTSCHKWWPNQFRLLLASLAYTLMAAIRRLGLAGSEFARAQCATIRLKLLKIGAVIVRNTRRVRFMLSSACPDQDLFALVAARLDPG
ncbi:MAG: IS1380 family transposase [Alphaproteobacteria bacterium]|nr:IS1380 family transposase [Alphaproteobacteria bacterium]